MQSLYLQHSFYKPFKMCMLNKNNEMTCELSLNTYFLFIKFEFYVVNKLNIDGQECSLMRECTLPRIYYCLLILKIGCPR